MEPMPETTTCPECGQGDVISISMTVSGRDLSFSTCHVCEAKWWHRDGEAVVLAQVIDTVVQR
jgi:transcription elongation factor Elf1